MADIDVNVLITAVGGGPTRETLPLTTVVRLLNLDTGEPVTLNGAPVTITIRSTPAPAKVIDWAGIVDTEGRPVPFSEENLERLLRAVPNIEDQISYRLNPWA